MAKKLISLILIVSFILPLGAFDVFAAVQPTIYLNEVFDDYAFNETATGPVTVTAGVDARVKAKSDKGFDKALYANAWGDNVYLYAPLSGVENTFVVTADVRFDGKRTTASLFTLGSYDLLSVSADGRVTLPDGKTVGGMSYGRWTTYTFAFDLRNESSQQMDIYVNGKLKLDNWKIKTKISAPSEISFFVAQPDEEGGSTEFMLDNFRVYGGNKVLSAKDFPSKGVSTEVKTFAETTQIDLNKEVTVYNIVDFDTNNSYTQVPKNNVLERRTLDDPDHPTVFYENRTNTSDAFIDIANDAAMQNEWKFIVEFNLYLIRNGYRISIAYTDTNGKATTGVFVTGSSIICGGVKGGSVPYNKWTKVSVLYDMTLATYSVWLNGVEAVSPQKLPNGRFTPQKVRIGTSSGGGPIEYYLDDIRIYSGNNVVDFTEETNSEGTNSEETVAPGGTSSSGSSSSHSPSGSGSSSSSSSLGLNSVFEKDSVALGYIGNAVVFKDDINSVVFDHKKYKYEDVSEGYPYIADNGTFMIPADLFGKAFGTAVVLNENEVTIGTDAKTTVGAATISASGKEYKLDSPVAIKDDVLYLPVRSVAQDILGRTYMLDRGMHIFDKTTFKYTNSELTYNTKEPIDSIYRFMQFEHKTAADIYAMMDSHLGGNVHPRIMTDSATLSEIKANSRTNDVVSEALATTLEQADKYMTTPVQIYDIPDGKRLLVATRNIMERLVALSAAYMMTGDTKYADRAWTEMENCFAWKDWNTAQHYLDNSELLYGVAVAFDSFYDYYTDEQKQIIMDKTWEHSLKHTVERYQGINFSGSEWRTAQSNWGFVCNGAVITAVLTFGREGNTKYQPYYDYLLECALQAIEYPIMLYFPDGAWEEGMAYWEYALRYLTSATLIPLYYCTGSTLDFMTPQGVTKVADMGLYMQSGNFGFNFSDNADEGKKSSEAVYALAMLLDDDSLMQTWNYEMESMDATHGARTLMWYRPSDDDNATDASSTPLDSYFRGIWVGSMKEEWYNTDGSTVFFKGGELRMNSHFDTGTFCFDTMGERWSVDLGKDSYNIAGGYTGFAGFELYAKRPEGHNCVVINPRADIDGKYYGGQAYDTKAEIIAMESKEKAAYTLIDLSETYKYDTSSYTRGFYLGDDRRTLTVQDEISLLEDNSPIYWFMHTRAKIDIDADGKGAVLSQNGKSVRVDMLTNASDAKFTVGDVGEDVQRFPTDPVRPGQLQGGTFTSVKALTLEAKGSGDVYITIKLSPMDGDFDTYADISYTPIKDWTLPDGAKADKLRVDMIYVNGTPIDGFAKGKFDYEITVPYGAPVPVITATSSDGDVIVEQSTSVDVPTYVYVAGSDGRKVKYTVNHDPVINVTTSLIAGLTGQVGIPEGYKALYGTPEISILEQAGNDEKCLVDGDFDTRWAATGEGVWCEIDLGQVTDISGVAVGIYSGDTRKNIFKIQISENGADYVTVYDGMSTGLTGTDYESYMFERKARYIRYEGFKNNQNTWNSVLELAAIVKK
ncbi:MAG: DUF4962 domain-containing protein [Ruminococcaceae bacterium]|nr:DUF4962 domain-containing protein [Oscillospiraceae bacterium]